MIDNVAILDELRSMRTLLLQQHEAKVQPIMVDTKTAAKMLGVGVSTVKAWAKEGKLRKFVDDGVHRFRVADLEAFVRERVK